MKMVFLRRRFTVAENISTEREPIFKTEGNHVIKCFSHETDVINDSRISKFHNIIFLKKGLNEFQECNEMQFKLSSICTPTHLILNVGFSVFLFNLTLISLFCIFLLCLKITNTAICKLRKLYLAI